MDEDNGSPVYHQKKLEFKSYCCLICGKSANNGLRYPKEQGITTFLNALTVRKECNGVPMESFKNYVDFDNKCWKGDFTNVKWHPSCYSTYTNPSNLSFISSRITVNPVPSYSTRSAVPSIDLKTKCMFCGYKKRNNDKHLVQIQYEHAIQKLKERCREKRDVQFEARIGGNFSNLPALDAKYHRSCYTMYMKDHQPNKDVQESVHDVCFNILVEYMDPLLFEGRALDTQTLLNRYKKSSQGEKL